MPTTNASNIETRTDFDKKKSGKSRTKKNKQFCSAFRNFFGSPHLKKKNLSKNYSNNNLRHTLT